MYVKKIHQFLSSTKKLHAKENWFLFYASRCRTRITRFWRRPSSTVDTADATADADKVGVDLRRQRHAVLDVPRL